MTSESLHPDINTLFLFRYLFDQKDDLVNLKQDVLDLQSFPERLMGSYKAEWEVYLKKMLRKSALPEDFDPITRLKELPQTKQEEYQSLSHIIEQTLNISTASNIKVIKTPLKAYTEQLMKL